jgi:hypothetical protein
MRIDLSESSLSERIRRPITQLQISLILGELYWRWLAASTISAKLNQLKQNVLVARAFLLLMLSHFAQAFFQNDRYN